MFYTHFRGYHLITENPLAEEDDYRMELLINLRRLERLDKPEYTDDERQEAEEMYEQRRQEELANDVRHHSENTFRSIKL